MCECGCSMGLDYRWRIMGADGAAYLFAVYGSCADCCAPAGVDVVRVMPKDFGRTEAMRVAPMPLTDDCDMFGISVIDIEVMRRQVKASIEGVEITDTHGVIDSDWAETLAEEAIPDLRSAVQETQKLARHGDTF